MKLLFILLLGLGFTQTKLTTKMYEVTLFRDDVASTSFELDEITGYNIDYGSAYIIGTSGGMLNNSNLSFSVQVSCDNYNFGMLGKQGTYLVNNDTFTWQSNSGCVAYAQGSYPNQNDGITFQIAVTAPFPEEDTGYIEEGYQFCVQPGANLLSFPCDNPISVNQSLPQGAENFITQIVGQGVATTYNPALGWVGSLDNFSPGSGYWFKSNESLCFEYDCVED